MKNNQNRSAEERQASQVARQQKRAQAASVNQPNFLGFRQHKVRNTLGVMALSGAMFAMSLTGMKAMAGSISESIANRALEAELQQPYERVKQDLEDGKISPDAVTEVTVDESQLAWAEATQLVGAENPVHPVVDIIVAQNGDNPQLDGGTHLIVPNSAIEQEAIANAGTDAKSQK